MGMEEIKKAILEYAEKSAKTKFYFKDMLAGVKKVIPDVKTPDVKKGASELVNEGVLEYFSTGSTTMYGLKGRGIAPEKAGAKMEES